MAACFNKDIVKGQLAWLGEGRSTRQHQEEKSEAGEMAQGVQAMVSKPELDPQTNTVGENSRKKPSDLHMHAVARVPPHFLSRSGKSVQLQLVGYTMSKAVSLGSIMLS